MSIQDLLSTDTIIIILNKYNIHLIRGPLRDHLTTHLTTKQEATPDPQICIKRLDNNLFISVEIYSDNQALVLSDTTIDETWAQMLVDAFENINSSITYQGSCFSV